MVRIRKVAQPRGKVSRRQELPKSVRHTESIAVLADSLPPVIYFLHTRDGKIKIGYTTNLRHRIAMLALGWEHVLAITPGSIADEAVLHQRFAAYRAYKREYYHPSLAIVEHINSIRAGMGLSPVETISAPKPAA